jgi:hypothetical protein
LLDFEKYAEKLKAKKMGRSTQQKKEEWVPLNQGIFPRQGGELVAPGNNTVSRKRPPLRFSLVRRENAPKLHKQSIWIYFV